MLYLVNGYITFENGETRRLIDDQHFSGLVVECPADELKVANEYIVRWAIVMQAVAVNWNINITKAGE